MGIGLPKSIFEQSELRKLSKRSYGSWNNFDLIRLRPNRL
jgi:hypothetical protein